MTRQSVRSPGLCHLHTPFASYDDDDDDDDDDDNDVCNDVMTIGMTMMIITLNQKHIQKQSLV